MDINTRTEQEWMERLTLEQVARVVFGSAGPQVGIQAAEDVAAAFKKSPALYESCRRKTAEFLAADPEMARRFERMEEALKTWPKGGVVTLEQAADILDVPLEHLEMDAVREGLLVDDDEGNLHPTPRALAGGMVVRRV